ncbi:MAG TPA: hypothetical protein VL984_11190 [Acidimicrobiales bacterium]|nr:hypothetical protein [Acidimicrobiales bacterium]
MSWLLAFQERPLKITERGWPRSFESVAVGVPSGPGGASQVAEASDDEAIIEHAVCGQEGRYGERVRAKGRPQSRARL